MSIFAVNDYIWVASKILYPVWTAAQLQIRPKSKYFCDHQKANDKTIILSTENVQKVQSRPKLRRFEKKGQHQHIDALFWVTLSLVLSGNCRRGTFKSFIKRVSVLKEIFWKVTLTIKCSNSQQVLKMLKQGSDMIDNRICHKFNIYIS